MGDIIAILAVGLGPVIFLFTYIYLRDKYDREPLRYLVICFILGVLSAFPAAYLEGFLESALGVTTEGGVTETLIYAIIVVAFVEEGVKYLILRGYMYNKPDFNEPYDGIMYAVAISLGFAAIENLMYMVGGDDAMATGFLRMFTAVPGHAMFAVVMGYFVGRAKFLGSNGNPFLERTKGLVAATIIHGLYDFFLFLDMGYISLLAFVVLILGIRLGMKALKIHEQASPHKGGIIDPESKPEETED